MTRTILCLVTRDDYGAVLGWAEWSIPNEYSREDNTRITAYGIDGELLFSRKGERHAQRRAHQLGMRVVIGDYFGLTDSRPEDESAPAYARRVYARLLPRTEPSDEVLR